MKFRSILILFSLLVLLLPGCKSTGTPGEKLAELRLRGWHFNEEEALKAAVSQHKLLLLVAGRERCPCTIYVRDRAFEASGKYTIRDIIRKRFVLLYKDVDYDEWYRRYASGLVKYTLPLVCVIDPEKDSTFLARLTGPEKQEVLFKMLKRFEKRK